MTMLILGVSDLEHDTSAALLGSQGFLAAIEEDKLSRASTAPAGVPQLAIDQCLRQSGACASDLSLAGVASRPKHAWLRDEGGRLTAFVSRAGASSYAMGAQDGLFWKLNQLQQLQRSLGPKTPLVNFEHHLCHAASAFYPSDFDRALVLTLDQSGDMWSGSLALGEGAEIKPLQSMPFPNSLGWFYSRVTELLGFRPGKDEHKVQWLSKEGAPQFLPVFRKLFRTGDDGLPSLDLERVSSAPSGRSVFSAATLRELDIQEGAVLRGTPHAAHIARSAQDYLEEAVIKLAETYREKTGAKYLCVAGGVFLNVMLVHALERHAGFERVFAQPVSGNPGTALGAAYLGRKHLEGSVARQPLRHLFLGPQFGEAEIKSVLDNCKTIYRYIPSEKHLVEETARLLHDDKIVAWYQGRLEYGHRALGNRTIVASAFSPYVMENLNRYVKHREDFHPFGLSVPSEDAPGLFDSTANCRFMSSIGTLKEAGRELKRFAFNDCAVRVHTVERQVNPRFWALLRQFGATAPAPVLVNTSFNLFGEPLVCDPREAIRSFYCSGIDALVMGNFLVIKP
ncbi:MAG TPA: carbamoyltransferase C-terminal domain-containing protein [Terriglobia bacterium]|nr:carbamoyltransferase C-terminal domain-containing protein [Terriglobia bacterium]